MVPRFEIEKRVPEGTELQFRTTPRMTARKRIGVAHYLKSHWIEASGRKGLGGIWQHSYQIDTPHFTQTRTVSDQTMISTFDLTPWGWTPREVRREHARVINSRHAIAQKLEALEKRVEALEKTLSSLP